MTDFWTQDPRDALRVGPDFDLASFDRRGTPGWSGDKAAAKEAMAGRADLLNELQERLYAHGRAGGDKRILIVVQGLDTAGKGGIARHVMGLVDPQGVEMHSFGVPTEEEREHHYLWRIEKALPSVGKIGLFDRSHYEDVLVVRVDELVERDVWEKRYDEINEWEKNLVDEGYTILKFAMMVSKDEQSLRLMERIDRPDKRWKYSTGDLDTRSKWDAFQAAYADVFRLTSTDHAPWYVLPSDRKWYSRLAVTEILTRTLVDFDLHWPKPRWQPETQRRRLARAMSPEALAESLADTEAIVTEANDTSLAVRRAAALLRHEEQDQSVIDAALAEIEAKRQELAADLAATLEHKRGLLTEVAPELVPDVAGEDEQPKKKSKKKKSKKKDKKKKKKKK
ncbi:hypothetical protein RPIT_12910 [Tessaracoccus flavus]|uniref:Uncharacterized protein n=1 Tax=Tessaracoccus flavus TaxID=1610493 RepID=A0A1Q2CHJ4_9ACTN|nr:PPK2 family polyphosphate kinase [Tessaracoccus flavus]AQP45596.1 hypothetical protein RPIT_12910 [Tessaracoccus flavus]SDY77905.1 polyphosphate:nucleotide phosphotransferase, PPK2 family [Tessaracoccus flavus]